MALKHIARVAGVAFILYIVAGIATMTAAGAGRELLNQVTAFSALVLGVTLYAITRAQDANLAMFALGCRILEAAPGRGELYFAVGSAVFCWLLLRGRIVPAALAWLGLVASVFLVMLLPLQTIGLFGGPGSFSSPVTWFVWLPMLVFELAFAAWLIVKGVDQPARAATI